jgi:flagellar protein FliO/FliZ
MRRFLPVGLLTLAPQIIYAAADTATSESLLMPALKMLGALGVVVGLLLLFYAASRKGFGILPRPKDGQIQMLETRALGGKKFLCLVRVRDRELLLGVSNERIDCLTELSAADSDFASTLDQVEMASPEQEEAQ